MKHFDVLRTLFLFLFALLVYGCSDILPEQEGYACGTITRAIVSDNFYYYYKGKKVPLQINPNMRYVVTKSEDPQSNVANYSTSYFVNVSKGINVDMYSEENNIDNIKKNEDVVSVEYVVGDSIPVALSNLFYVKLKSQSDLPLLESEAKKIGCIVEHAVETDSRWIRLSNNKESIFESSLDASNYLYETGLFDDVDPGFIFNYQYSSTPTDALYSEQWGVKSNAADFEKVWETNKGKPFITTAIVDGGIYKNHPDLVGAMHPYAYNCSTGGSNTSVSRHGTLIAGIIAAQHNSIGIAGVAPNTKLMDISCSMSATPTISEELSNGINNAWQHGADVLNLSLGTQGGAGYENLHSALLENSLNNALTKGRNGKGCIVVVAAGNNHIIEYPASANSDFLVVGSISSDGKLADNSGRGKQLDVVAPGVGIKSTDSNGDYFSDEGTSYAAPYVAGLAALILSEDSSLTQKQVCDLIIASTKNDSWNKDYGYGCIDAYKAMQILRGTYFEILNRRGFYSIAYGNSDYYVRTYPNTGISWKCSEGLSLRLNPSTYSVFVDPTFDSSSKQVSLSASFNYKGYPVSLFTEFTMRRDPIIYGIEKMYVFAEDGRLDYKINCADPDANVTVSGENVIEFPYAGDANYSEHPSMYFSVETTYWDHNKQHVVTIQTKNKYSSDWQTFVVE